MNLVSVKDADKLPPVGVRVSFEKVDGNIHSVTISDEGGNFFVVKKTNTYSDTLGIFIKEPPKSVDKFLLKGVYAGVNIEKYFDDEWEATSALGQFPTSDVTVEKVTVTEE